MLKDGELKMKMSASEYNALPTIRNLRGRIRRMCNKQRRLWFLKNETTKKAVGGRVTIIYRDAREGNILKTRRYKGRIRKG